MTGDNAIQVNTTPERKTETLQIVAYFFFAAELSKINRPMVRNIKDAATNPIIKLGIAVALCAILVICSGIISQVMLSVILSEK